MKKKNNRFLAGFFLGMLAMTVVMGGIGTGWYLSHKESNSAILSTQVTTKVDFLSKVIDAYYLDKVDNTKLKDGIYKGLMSGLGDPYSAYYTAEEYKQIQESNSGTYYGIGVTVSQNSDTGVITANKVFENAPAAIGGMKSGDEIYKLNGENVTGRDLNEIVNEMKGEKGTELGITVYRAETKEYIDLKVTTNEVNVPTVSYKMLDNDEKIGYVQISQFEEVTYDQFTKAIKDLKKQGMKAVVFDVRSNPGGMYNIVTKMLDELLPEGTIVYTKDKYGKKEVQTSDAKCLNMPMVVLQNRNSASASEIFAGAIQDFNVGKIVGTQSFGKGIVQTILPLSDGSAVKLTIEKYYTPSGKNIHGKGITPDVRVDADDNSSDDVQLIKAIETIKELITK